MSTRSLDGVPSIEKIDWSCSQWTTMPAQSPSHRPAQTLRQAKKAFRKSSARPKLSASELAIIERRAVLQERADRIKERESRRKANIRKREEKKEREKETLLRQGKELPKEGGIKVGPSQLDLTRFLPVVKNYACKEVQRKSKGVDKCQGEMVCQSQTGVSAGSEPKVDEISMAPPLPLVDQHPASVTTKPLALNVVVQAEIQDTDFAGLFVSNTQVERELCSSPDLQVQVKEDHRIVPSRRATSPRSEASAMVSAQPSTQEFQCCDPQTHNTLEDLGRLSHANGSNSSSALPHLSDDAVETWDSEESTLLANMCTQDLLEYTDSPQLKKQEASGRNKSFSSVDYSDGFDDNDLQCLAAQVDQQS